MIYGRGFYVGMKLLTVTGDVLDMTAPTKDHYCVSLISLYSLQKYFFMVIYLFFSSQHYFSAYKNEIYTESIWVDFLLDKWSAVVRKAC